MPDIELKDGSTTTDPRLDRCVFFDERSWNYRAISLLKVAQIRKPRTRRWKVSQTLDQGREGACVGFGISHELIANPAAVQGITNEFARQLYFAAQKLDPWEGGSYPGAHPVYEGTAVLAGLKAAQAMQYFDEYRWCFGLDDLILTVGYVGPVIIGVNWYEGMMDYDQNNFIHVTGGIAGGHCTLVSGVDTKGEFAEIHNSWGDSRKMKISFADLNRLLKEEGEAAVPIRRHFTPRPPKHIVT